MPNHVWRTVRFDFFIYFFFFTENRPTPRREVHFKPNVVQYAIWTAENQLIQLDGMIKKIKKLVCAYYTLISFCKICQLYLSISADS